MEVRITKGKKWTNIEQKLGSAKGTDLMKMSAVKGKKRDLMEGKPKPIPFDEREL